ncbi:hypothetical protein IQ272_13220 [Chroococcidiopsidales cyanobacterium LEGE 13417]|nr:hypothetical protein [Chroococcidiopsidales cyanobacterium LEGE 13417]
MAKYTLLLKIKDSQDEYRYALDLNLAQENNPEQFFNLEIRESLRNNLQKQSFCKINDTYLNQAIANWVQDIKEGYRDSSITLDLPSLLATNLSNLQEIGKQEMPALIEPSISDIEPCGGMLPPLLFS